MSSSNPPYPNFNGITYNSSFFSTATSGGLTQAQANSLYLRKTIADTASAIETFTSGTKSSNYDTITPSSLMLIGSSQTSSFMAIGCADSRSGNITLASGANQSANINLCIGSTNTGEVRIANDPTNAGAIRIGDNGLGATGANITIGSSTMPTLMNGNTTIANLKSTSVESTAIGNVFNLATTQTTGILNIGSSSSRSGNINIGNSGNTGTINIATINTNNSNASPAISIGADAGTKTIKIGNNGNSVHCSSVDLTSSGINNIVNTSGDLSIANLQTSGALNIGTNVSRTSNINIGTGATGGTMAINIGSSGNTGPISISTLTGTINIGSDQTTGAINIGTSVNRINTSGSLGAINIGTGANANAFGINVGNGTAAVTINGTVALTDTTHATTIAGALYLTSTTNTNIFSGPLQLNKPINVAYSSIAPSATYLGGTVGGGFTAAALGPSIYAFQQSFQLPIGTYLFNLGGQLQYSTGTFTACYSTIYSGATQYAHTTNLTPYYFGTNTITSTTPFFTGFNGNIVLAVTVANLWYTTGLTWAGSAGGNVSSIIGVFTATRLY